MVSVFAGMCFWTENSCHASIVDSQLDVKLYELSVCDSLSEEVVMLKLRVTLLHWQWLSARKR